MFHKRRNLHNVILRKETQNFFKINQLQQQQKPNNNPLFPKAYYLLGNQSLRNFIQ